LDGALLESAGGCGGGRPGYRLYGRLVFLTIIQGDVCEFHGRLVQTGKGVHVPIQAGDLETIFEPCDLLGINYYTGNIVRYKKTYIKQEDTDLPIYIT
jgi:beta-glucosidase/6-phospho-beta-glucosidase/beta-galactosidase